MWLRWEDSGEEEGTDGNKGTEVDVVQLQILVVLEVIRNLKKWGEWERARERKVGNKDVRGDGVTWVTHVKRQALLSWLIWMITLGPQSIDYSRSLWGVLMGRCRSVWTTLDAFRPSEPQRNCSSEVSLSLPTQNWLCKWRLLYIKWWRLASWLWGCHSPKGSTKLSTAGTRGCRSLAQRLNLYNASCTAVNGGVFFPWKWCLAEF